MNVFLFQELFLDVTAYDAQNIAAITPPKIPIAEIFP